MYGLVKDKGTWEMQAKTFLSVLVPSMPRKWDYVKVNQSVFPLNVNFYTQN